MFQVFQISELRIKLVLSHCTHTLLKSSLLERRSSSDHDVCRLYYSDATTLQLSVFPRELYQLSHIPIGAHSLHFPSNHHELENRETWHRYMDMSWELWILYPLENFNNWYIYRSEIITGISDQPGSAWKPIGHSDIENFINWDT